MNTARYYNGAHRYDVPSLWTLAKMLPKRKIRTAELVDQLKYDCWDKAPPLDFGKLSAEHQQQTIAADLRFPLLLDPDGWVADGNHRLLKAFLTDRKFVRVSQFPSLQAMMPARL